MVRRAGGRGPVLAGCRGSSHAGKFCMVWFVFHKYYMVFVLFFVLYINFILLSFIWLTFRSFYFLFFVIYNK